jgi:hypothetical protein
METILAVVQQRQASGPYIFDTVCINLEITFSNACFDLGKPLDDTWAVTPRQNTWAVTPRRNESMFVIGFSSNSTSSRVISFFSGNYLASIKKQPEYTVRAGNNANYQEGLSDCTGGVFYYCNADKAWVFMIPALKNNYPIWLCYWSDHKWHK